MKIDLGVVDLPPSVIATLGAWASVSRTFDSVLTGVEGSGQHADGLEEMEILQKPLDSLHQAIREKLWSIQCGKLIREMHGVTNNIICRIPSGHKCPCRGS